MTYIIFNYVFDKKERQKHTNTRIYDIKYTVGRCIKPTGKNPLDKFYRPFKEDCSNTTTQTYNKSKNKQHSLLREFVQVFNKII